MKDLSIKVNIAGRMYPLTVQQREEENIRRAVKAIDEMVRDYEQNYAVKDKQDLLAMCALQFATQVAQKEIDKLEDSQHIEDQIEKLNQMLHDF